MIIIKLKQSETFQGVDLLYIPKVHPGLLGSVQTGEYPATVACQPQA